MEKDKSISELMKALKMSYIDECFYENLSKHNADVKFVQAYLDEMRGPTDIARFDVKNTWRLKNMCKDFASDVGNIHLLMSGIPTKKLLPAIKYEFPKLASTKAVFGSNGYYFTNCSTKAANQCVLQNWSYQRGADEGTHKPKNGEILHIMFSEVALGRIKRNETYDKHGISQYDKCDSLVFKGLYENGQYQMTKCVTENKSYDVVVPRGPFVRNSEVQRSTDKDILFFYYDEIYVQNIAQINPCMLAQVQYISS